MKVLILSCSTGGGHNACGKYIASELKANAIECDFVDYFSILGNKLSKEIEKIYLKSLTGHGNIFKEIYKLGETYNKISLPSPVYELNKLAKNKVLDYILKHNYDVIICPHLFPAMAITALKKDGHKIKLINVATDYAYIPFWNETDPDYFIIPHASLKKEFIEKGISQEKLIPLGIPVATSFINSTNNLRYRHDKPNILVTSGSMGFGNLEVIVKALLDNVDAYVTVICGTNKDVFQKLSKIQNSNLIVKGFISNMNDYIKNSDIVLTKPGGLTSTEVAILNKPMIHIMPIPGVENYNATFFKENKLSLVSNNVDEIVSNTKLLLNDEDLKKEMISNQRMIINRSAASDLVKFLEKISI